MLFEKGTRLVMIGDSVTDCGRARPLGEGKDGALGNGYPSIVDSMLMARYPQLGVRVTNMGVSGNTVLDLKARWQTDVIDLAPDYLSVCIGINDVWRWFDRPRITEKRVDAGVYSATLESLITWTKPLVKKIIMITPYYMEPNAADPMRAMMDGYSQACRRIAGAHDLVLVDFQAAYDRILGHMHPNAIAWDRVHPNQIGHMVMAAEFLRAVGFDFAGM